MRRILRVNHEAWSGTGKSARSSSFRISTDTLQGGSYLDWDMHMQWVGSLNIPRYLVSMMDFARGLLGYVLPLWGVTGVSSAYRKGWACGVAEKGSDWLGS